MINPRETIELFSYEISLNSGKTIESDHIVPLFESLMTGDTLKVGIVIDGTDPSSFVIKNILDLEKIYEQNDYIDEDSETIIKVEIIKKSINIINIYRLECFIEYLELLTIKQLLTVFGQYRNSTNKVMLTFKEYEKINFSTNLFCTYNTQKEINNLIKKERLENLNLVTNTSGISAFNFIPEDFRVLDCSDSIFKLKAIFDKIATFLSIAFISDWSELNDDKLHFKILGYKKIDISVPFLHKVHSVDIFFKIYRWIFENGNGSIEDKLGLARNIISRFIKYDNQELVLDDDAYSSIITSYKIYLKENVEKYIETKNKVAELTTELSIKIGEMNHLIVNNFKNNNFTIIGYFISLFVFNSIAFKQTTIFTKHTFAISLIVLIISRSYLYLTSIQINKDIALNKKYFLRVKSIYKDLFDESELNNLFNLDFFNSSSKEVINSFKTYHNIWILEIYLVLIVSIALTFSGEIIYAFNFYLKYMF